MDAKAIKQERMENAERVFGGTPKTAGETPALPEQSVSIRG
jgi:hypothetical protein